MASNTNNKNENEAAIRQLVENWAKAVRDMDMEAVLAHHSEDIVMYDVPKPFESVGLATYRKTWDLFFSCTKRGVFDIQELHICAGENVAFCFAKMQCGNKSKGADYEALDFRLTIGFKKIEGQWTFVHEHHSVPAE